ncbi:DUF6192 family protein [Streptomyces sp. NPDC001858]
MSGLSFTVHNILAGITDDEERWTTILTPPGGKFRWTPDEDKVRVVQELTCDDHVAAEVTTGLLRRPDVSFRAMSDDYPDYGLAAA